MKNYFLLAVAAMTLSACDHGGSNSSGSTPVTSDLLTSVDSWCASLGDQSGLIESRVFRKNGTGQISYWDPKYPVGTEPAPVHWWLNSDEPKLTLSFDAQKPSYMIVESISSDGASSFTSTASGGQPRRFTPCSQSAHSSPVGPGKPDLKKYEYKVDLPSGITEFHSPGVWHMGTWTFRIETGSNQDAACRYLGMSKSLGTKEACGDTEMTLGRVMQDDTWVINPRSGTGCYMTIIYCQ